MRQRFETENFFLDQSVIDSNGDSSWVITQKSDKKIFYIHVFKETCINIKMFHGNKINRPWEAIRTLCQYIAEQTGKTPSINIHYKNKSLISICYKAGFRKVTNVKHLYTFKKY